MNNENLKPLDDRIAEWEKESLPWEHSDRWKFIDDLIDDRKRLREALKRAANRKRQLRQLNKAHMALKLHCSFIREECHKWHGEACKLRAELQELKGPKTARQIIESVFNVYHSEVKK